MKHKINRRKYRYVFYNLKYVNLTILNLNHVCYIYQYSAVYIYMYIFQYSDSWLLLKKFEKWNIYWSFINCSALVRAEVLLKKSNKIDRKNAEMKFTSMYEIRLRRGHGIHNAFHYSPSGKVSGWRGGIRYGSPE